MKRGQGKKKLDRMKSVDLRFLHQNGLLQIGRVSVLKWISKGKERGSISVTAAEDHIVLNYFTQHSANDPSNEVTQVIRLTRMKCYLGGTRPFMKCPHCDRQVLLLYPGPKYFLCRHCYQLTYETRNLGQLDLQVRRVQNARAKLGAPANITVPIAPCAKWKHRSRYDRLRLNAEEQKQKFLGLMGQKLQAQKA